MKFYIIPAALIVTFLITLIISAIFKRPLRGLWIFFLIVFMATWAGHLWITPFGPATWGISWIPVIIISIFFWILILALIPPWPPAQGADNKAVSEEPLIKIGIFLWVVMILLAVSIAVGHYRLH
jgi:hypothetical protein